MALSVAARKRRYINSLQALISFATEESGRMLTTNPIPEPASLEVVHELFDTVRRCRSAYAKELTLDNILGDKE